MKADWTDVLYPLYLEYRQTFHVYLNRKISSLSPPPISALQMQHEIFRDRRVPGSCLTLEYLTTLSITVFYFLYVSITIGFTTCRGDEISLNFQTYIFNTKK